MDYTKAIHKFHRCNLITIIIFMLLTVINSSCQKNDKVFRSDTEVQITGKYMAWACGDFTPQIKPIKISDQTVSLDDVDFGLAFWIKNNMASPDMIDEICVASNMFEITGYYHYNIVNGKKQIQPRFDLTGWQPVLPYKRWSKKGEKEVLKTNDFRKYLEQKENNVDPEEYRPAMKYLIDCD